MNFSNINNDSTFSITDSNNLNYVINSTENVDYNYHYHQTDDIQIIY